MPTSRMSDGPFKLLTYYRFNRLCHWPEFILISGVRNDPILETDVDEKKRILSSKDYRDR